MSSASENQILGVTVKALKSHGDERGFFREIIRSTDAFFTDSQFAPAQFGQWSHSYMQKDVVKAWHYHHKQIDWWYVPMGDVQTVLFDNREESPTYKSKMVIRMGESRYSAETKEVCVMIPPGVLHGCKVLSNDAHLFYITSMTYDTNEEGRFPYNSDLVGHNWGSDVIVVENDKRTFVPTSTRTLLR